MKTEASVFSSPVLFLVLSLSLLKLAYGSDPLLPSQNDALFCPGFDNCTDPGAVEHCRYNRVGQTDSSTSFNTSDGVSVNCDGVEVNFTYPSSTDESFVGNASWICHRYYNWNGSHFVVPEITLNKPSDVSDTQIVCHSTMGDCTLLNGTSTGVKFITGMPNYCVPWVDIPMPDTVSFLPSQTENLTCQGFKSCTDNMCNFNRMTEKNLSRVFYPDEKTEVKCEDLKVYVNYPKTNDSEYVGQQNVTCFLYDNGNGTTFEVAEFNFSKPSDVDRTQVTCSAEGSTICTLLNETSTQLLFVAGLPSGCAPWAPPIPPPPPETTTAATTSTTMSETSTSDGGTSTTEATTSTGSSDTTAKPPVASTSGPNDNTTTPAGGTTTTKGPSGEPRNGEAAMVLVLAAALFAGQYI